MSRHTHQLHSHAVEVSEQERWPNKHATCHSADSVHSCEPDAQSTRASRHDAPVCVGQAHTSCTHHQSSTCKQPNAWHAHAQSKEAVARAGLALRCVCMIRADNNDNNIVVVTVSSLGHKAQHTYQPGQTPFTQGRDGNMQLAHTTTNESSCPARMQQHDPAPPNDEITPKSVLWWL